MMCLLCDNDLILEDNILDSSGELLYYHDEFYCCNCKFSLYIPVEKKMYEKSSKNILKYIMRNISNITVL